VFKRIQMKYTTVTLHILLILLAQKRGKEDRNTKLHPPVLTLRSYPLRYQNKCYISEHGVYIRTGVQEYGDPKVGFFFSCRSFGL
jgi:hypothetical protein